MKRTGYIICQKSGYNKGTPQAISDGKGKLEYVYGGYDGLRKAKEKVVYLNRDYKKQPLHIRKVIIIFKEELKQKM